MEIGSSPSPSSLQQWSMTAFQETLEGDEMSLLRDREYRMREEIYI